MKRETVTKCVDSRANSVHSTEIFSFTLSVNRLKDSFLNEANFLMIIVGLTVKISFVLTSLSYFNSLSMSVGAIGKENLSPLITEVILATIKFCLLTEFLEIITAGLYFVFERSVYG